VELLFIVSWCKLFSHSKFNLIQSWIQWQTSSISDSPECTVQNIIPKKNNTWVFHSTQSYCMKDIPYGRNGNKSVIRNQKKYHIYRTQSYRAKQDLCKYKMHVISSSKYMHKWITQTAREDMSIKIYEERWDRGKSHCHDSISGGAGEGCLP
jgi:hypothetical protein